MAATTPDPESAPHFALVRQIAADAGHIPPEALTAWQQAGPLRVRAEIATHLRRLVGQGLLNIEDEMLAAKQLVQLTAGSAHSAPWQAALEATELDRVVRIGVRVFLAAYRAEALSDANR